MAGNFMEMTIALKASIADPDAMHFLFENKLARIECAASPETVAATETGVEFLRGESKKELAGSRYLISGEWTGFDSSR